MIGSATGFGPAAGACGLGAAAMRSPLAAIRADRGLVVAAALLVALLSALVGFSHRSLDLRPALAAFALPDGSAPLICLTGETPQTGGDPAGGLLCDACTLAAAPGLLSRPPEAAACRTPDLDAGRPAEPSTVIAAPVVTASARGPPEASPSR